MTAETGGVHVSQNITSISRKCHSSLLQSLKKLLLLLQYLYYYHNFSSLFLNYIFWPFLSFLLLLLLYNPCNPSPSLIFILFSLHPFFVIHLRSLLTSSTLCPVCLTYLLSLCPFFHLSFCSVLQKGRICSSGKLCKSLTWRWRRREQRELLHQVHSFVSTHSLSFLIIFSYLITCNRDRHCLVISHFAFLNPLFISLLLF